MFLILFSVWLQLVPATGKSPSSKCKEFILFFLFCFLILCTLNKFLFFFFLCFIYHLVDELLVLLLHKYLMLGVKLMMQIKWICPTAPTRPVALLGGFPCTACKNDRLVFSF